MACFTATIVEAVVSTAVTAVVRHSEKKNGTENAAVKFSDKLSWLNRMLWGGSALLAFEHVWHGEVTPWFPFLTAAETPESTAVMLNEIATVGVGMCALVTAVWVGMVAITSALEKKADNTASDKA